MREVRYVFTLTSPAHAEAFEAELENHLTSVLESASEFGDGQVFDLGLVKDVVPDEAAEPGQEGGPS